jgi:hypothetical protein
VRFGVISIGNVWCVGIDVFCNVGSFVLVHTVGAVGSSETSNVMDQTARGSSQKTVRYLQLLSYYFDGIM